MAKFQVTAVRTYYSTLEFDVEANSRKEAEQIASQMIEDCEVEFDGVDGYDDHDDIEVCEVK